MNESETRAEYIDPKLKMSGWGEVEDSKILREYRFTDGKIQPGTTRTKPEIADYILVYKNCKLAIIEAKQISKPATEGVAQAKTYALKLNIPYTYSTNGKEIYEICMTNGKETYTEKFPTPQELWKSIYSDQNTWKQQFANIPFENINRTKTARYYQEIAVNKTLDAIAEQKQRLLLTLATGTGKTFIAFQIAWKLFKTRWNLSRDGKRRPRILFLADRNILANQAFNGFSAFSEDALVRINPADIRKKGNIPTNGSIFFTIFQTFMSGPDNTPYYGEYPQDFFDFIIIDECHRGGANDEGNWKAILEYFSPAVQLGLTATPKRKDNVDTYRYFGEPIYSYSLKEGIYDGFLTPFKVKRIKTTLDDYVYTSDDQIIEGEIEEGRIYTESDFNRAIEIEEREAKRVKIILEEINQTEKTIIFCANQGHALLVRDLVNRFKKSTHPNYCVRVTANDGAIGEQHLSEFQDNEKTIPTILTTSQKLSTGVDARNVRNIVLMRPVNSMIEFKQIIGRGTRLFDGKEFFTIFDFVDAYKHFSDPEWDGEPLAAFDYPEPKSNIMLLNDGLRESEEKLTMKSQKVKIKLRDGKEREIQHMIADSFWSAEGKPLSTEEFMNNLLGDLPNFYKTAEELQHIWSNPDTRVDFLKKIAELGYTRIQLESIQKALNAQDNDMLDVLLTISFVTPALSRKERVERAHEKIVERLNNNQKEFVEFVLENYVRNGEEQLNYSNLSELMKLKYHSLYDAELKLGETSEVRTLFLGLQEKLYKNP